MKLYIEKNIFCGGVNKMETSFNVISKGFVLKSIYISVCKLSFIRFVSTAQVWHVCTNGENLKTIYLGTELGAVL